MQPLKGSAVGKSATARSTDFLVGLTAFMGAVVCVCLGLGFVGRDTPGNATVVWSLLGGGVVLGFIFLYHQSNTAGARLIDVELVADSKRWPLFAATFFREAATMGVSVRL